MNSISSRVAKGAFWMIGLRLLQRSLGLISTLVLARLLMPEDFGVIAMALAITALVELLTMLGLDMALIQKKGAGNSHFDTAWTLGLIFKAASALLLVLSAGLIAEFYSDARLTDIIYIYAAVAFLSGFENIGLVAYRKELEFRKEFNFQIIKKVLAVVVTVGLALYFRNYWALALGTLFAQFTGVALSYLIHPYRPKLTLHYWREMLNFSSWIVFNNFAIYARDRGADFVIGKVQGAEMVGNFRIASEISSLPTTAIYLPITRAVFPGFSKISDEPLRLKNAYLAAQAAVSIVSLPAVIMLMLLADPLVTLLLGQNWLHIIPVIQILCLCGATKVAHGNRHALFMSVGKPSWIGFVTVIELLIMYPAIIYALMHNHDLEVIAWIKFISSLATIPLGLHLISKVIDIKRTDWLAISWRPIAATVLMSVVVTTMHTYLPGDGSAYTAALQMLLLTPLCVISYTLFIWLLWQLAGKPAGIESKIIGSEQFTKVIKKITGMIR